MARDSAAKAPKEKKPGRFSQIRDIYTATKQVDPKIGMWMLGAFALVFLLFLGLGFLLNHPILYGIFGVLFGILAAVIVMSRRAEKAAYARIDGHAGAVGAALDSIRKGWYIQREPVAADVNRPGDIAGAAMVYRVLGRPGVVLVGEGPAGRVEKLLAKEKQRVERVAPGVPVHTMRVGEGDSAVPLAKLTQRVQRLKPQITKDEMAMVNKRLKALGGMRAPIPKGVDPTRARMDRKALRGR